VAGSYRVPAGWSRGRGSLRVDPRRLARGSRSKRRGCFWCAARHPRFWDSPSVDVVSVHTLATLPLAPPFVPPAGRVANACEAVPYRPATAAANREVPATAAGKDLKFW